MPRRILAGLRRLVPEADAVLLAVSGGSDSVALLRGLVDAGRNDAARDDAGPGDVDRYGAVASERGDDASGSATAGVAAVPRLVVAHLDHGLREGSAADATWVEALCREFGVPFHAEAVRVADVAARRRRNVEEMGRTLRYEFLTRIARQEGCRAVATAHTRDDQAETVMLQLLRGSAHPSGIAPQRSRIVRPLLDLSKADLRHWLDGIGQAWREDPSNRDTSRDRSWIRHQLMPRLEARRPGAASRIARFGQLQRDQAEFLEAEAKRRFGTAPVARAALAAAPVALQREVLVRAIRDAGGEPDRLHVDALVAALAAPGNGRRDLPGGVRVRILQDSVDVIAAAAEVGDDRAVRILEREEELPPGLPAEVLAEGALEERSWRAADVIRLAGGRRKVSDVLAEHGVPREERPSTRVLARGGEVLWIEGLTAAVGIDDASADPDLPFMRRALELADEAADEGELPVGAVVVRDGRIVGEGRNRREGSGDPSAHAEIEAMRRAAEAEGDWRLAGATLYVTLEPCPMCAGAVVASHLQRVVWGAANRREGAFGTVCDVGAAPWKRVPERRGGLLAREARHRLERFFAARRGAASPTG